MSCKWIPPHRRNFLQKRRLKITSSEQKSKFDNHRYPNSKEYRQNWIDLEYQILHSDHSKRVKHIESILERVSEVEKRKDPLFLELMYSLRFEALVTAYFEEAEREIYLSRYSLVSVDTCPETTEWETAIIILLRLAVGELKKNVTTFSCNLFTEADKEFGWYRHQRWINSF
jgi:hypothetical protein